MVKNAWKALHFKMLILKQGDISTKFLAYRSLLRPILEYGAACWDTYRKGQMRALERVQKAVRFAYHIRSKTVKLPQPIKISCICAVYKVYSGVTDYNGTAI
jgi:hypothetical protein